MLYIISAPSGAGKSSLINELLKIKSFCNIKRSISYTTRTPRPGEMHGKHYFFVNHDEFNKMISQNVFIEYAIVFDHYYGTSIETIKNSLTVSSDMLLNIDWQGAKQIKKKIPESKSIFIFPPSKYTLFHRLNNRQQDSKKLIEKRMTQAVEEMRHYIEYDYLIINDDFDIALSNLKTIVLADRLRVMRQKFQYSSLIHNLLIN